ncbi:MAG TPA: LOG family protein, partial [Candidatus Kapabacteria bacterium]|nr:LOG family protein [Candidatus Kapabacteria bacterium]
FVALPGAVGTMEEFFEIIVLNQLNYIDKPLAFYNINNFYNKLIDFLRHTYEEGFLWENTYRSLFFSENADEIVNFLKNRII